MVVEGLELWRGGGGGEMWYLVVIRVCCCGSVVCAFGWLVGWLVGWGFIRWGWFWVGVEDLTYGWVGFEEESRVVEPLLGVGEVGHFFLKGGMFVLSGGKLKEGGGGWLMLVIFLAYVASLGKGGWPTYGTSFWRFIKP